LKVAENEGVSRANHARKGTKYHKPRRDIASKEIRRLIVDQGLTNRQISERLNIPEKTIERYISNLYKHDNQLLSSLKSDEDMLVSWSILRDRLDHHRQEILANIARNPKATFMEQIKAWHLVCELEAADLRILQNTPALVSRQSELSVKQLLMLNNNKKEEEEVRRC
jgi:hypothetical protein